MKQETIFSPNLAGIEVGETRISDVKGEQGILSYRGFAIDELVQRPFWQVVWLVLFGNWPKIEQENELQEFMALHSRLNQEELGLLAKLPDKLHPMLVLQGIVPVLNLKTEAAIQGLSNDAQQGLLIAAKLPSIIAAWRQLELGNELVTADVNTGFHEGFLMMFNGCAATAEQVRVLDATQILQMEHSFNASTFAGRVCASTLAPIQSSLSASIGTLFGVLHGGADQAALEMARQIGAAEDAAAYVEKCLQEKIKIMGMGHREYKVVDPRALILKPMAKSLCKEGEARRLFETLEAVEAACQIAFEKQGKQIQANMEFYKGAVFHQLGIPPSYFTALFAMARVYGYIAHYLEFSQNSNLIRPRARYIGH